MKLSIPSDIAAEDVPAVSLGLYHTAKRIAASGRQPENGVEFTLNERSNDAFRTYLNGMHKSLMDLISAGEIDG